MSPRHWKIVSALALSCCFTPVAAEAGPEEDNALAAFEAACLDNINDPSRAARMAVAAGLKEVPEPQRSAIMDDKPGRAWINVAAGSRQFLKLGDNGACGIAAPYANGREVLALFTRHSRSRLVKTEQIGSETQSIFAVTHRDPRGGADGHAIVMIQSSSLQSVISASLTSLPESVARAGGISEQNWP
jgi:hypothetical protein